MGLWQGQRLFCWALLKGATVKLQGREVDIVQVGAIIDRAKSDIDARWGKVGLLMTLITTGSQRQPTWRRSQGWRGPVCRESAADKHWGTTSPRSHTLSGVWQCLFWTTYRRKSKLDSPTQKRRPPKGWIWFRPWWSWRHNAMRRPRFWNLQPSTSLTYTAHPLYWCISEFRWCHEWHTSASSELPQNLADTLRLCDKDEFPNLNSLAYFYTLCCAGNELWGGTIVFRTPKAEKLPSINYGRGSFEWLGLDGCP